MHTVHLTTAFQIAFAAGVVLATLTLALAAVRAVGRLVLAILAVLVSGAAVAGWVFFALRDGRTLGLSAAGLTACAIAAWASLLLRRALRHAETIDAQLETAQATLRELIQQEAADRTAELDRTLARARRLGVAARG